MRGRGTHSVTFLLHEFEDISRGHDIVLGYALPNGYDGVNTGSFFNFIVQQDAAVALFNLEKDVLLKAVLHCLNYLCRDTSCPCSTLSRS